GNGDTCPGLDGPHKPSPSPEQTLVVPRAMVPHHPIKSTQAAIWDFNKSQAPPEIKPLEQIKSESLGENRMRTVLLGTFAGLALLLSAIGVYGVISYSVTQRTHEIGIRAALGASNAALIRLILIRGLVLTSAGLIIGLAGALGLTRLMTIILYKVGARDPGTMIAVAFILA